MSYLLELERRNTALILGRDEDVSLNKQGTMIDLYPTVLEILGYNLSDGRAALGVSLLSERESFMSGSSYWKKQYFLGSDLNLSDLLWN